MFSSEIQEDIGFNQPLYEHTPSYTSSQPKKETDAERIQKKKDLILEEDQEEKELKAYYGSLPTKKKRDILVMYHEMLDKADFNSIALTQKIVFIKILKLYKEGKL